MQRFKDFWEGKTTSLHRSDSADFYRLKAAEHASIIQQEDRVLPAVDIGCGAGELLYFLGEYCSVQVGLDFSESMLAIARERLKGKKISLLNQDAFNYLESSAEPVWLACGSINQYLEQSGQQRLLDVFVKNPSASSVYLFDCVDPIRYVSLPLGLGYVPKPAPKRLRIIYNTLVLLKLSLASMLNPSANLVVNLGEMGYGFAPQFWLAQGSKRGLAVEIVSSKYYEYRYHVAIRKKVDA